MIVSCSTFVRGVQIQWSLVLGMNTDIIVSRLVTGRCRGRVADDDAGPGGYGRDAGSIPGAPR